MPAALAARAPATVALVSPCTTTTAGGSAVEVGLELAGGLADLAAAAAAADAEAQVGLAHLQLGQELTRQVLVVVLPGVDHPGRGAEQADEGSELDQLGSRAQHERDAAIGESSGHGRSVWAACRPRRRRTTRPTAPGP